MDLLKELKLLRCSQNWGLDDCEDIEENYRKKYGDGPESSSEYASQTPVFQFFYHISFELYKKGKYPDALEYINRTFVTDEFMEKYDRVFKYLSRASMAHILYRMNAMEEATQIVNELKDQSFSDIEVAGFLYVESWMHYAYGKEGAVRCITLIKSALKIVPDEAEFNFTLGSVLGKIRNFTFPAPLPSKEELDACQKAVESKRHVCRYSICVMRLFMEMRHLLPYDQKSACNEEAVSIYKNLLKHRESLSGNDIARCIHDLCKFRSISSNDLNELEDYAEIALKKADTIITNQYIGYFYIQNKQLNKALQCLNKVSTSTRYISGTILLLMYRKNGNSLSEEISTFISKLEDNFKNESDGQLRDFYLDVSIFYFFVVNDFDMACEYFLLACKSGVIIKTYYIRIIQNSTNLNYLSILLNELLARSPKNVIINEAIEKLKSLPEDITRPNLWAKKNLSLHELKNSLIC